jgi:hypothetical protein
MNRGELKRLKRWPADLLAKPEVKVIKQERPAILELSPVKGSGKVSKLSKVNKPKSVTDKNQTDLFE